MLINSAQKMPSIQHRISMESRDPAHQLSANILSSYMWTEIVLLYMVLFQSIQAFMQLMSALRQFRKHFSPASVYSLMYVL